MDPFPQARSYLVLFLVTLLLLSPLGCGDAPSPQKEQEGEQLPEERPHKGGRLVIAVPGPIVTLSPWAAVDPSSLCATRLIHEGLGAYGEDGRLMPQLAEQFTCHDGGRSWVAVLKSGSTWADGSQVTPEDVLATYRLLMEPHTRSPMAALVAGVVDCEKEGNSAIRLNLRHPSGRVPPLLALPLASASNLEEHDPRWYIRSPLGTGPFMLESFRPHTSMVLTRNPRHQPQALLDSIELMVVPERELRQQAVLSGAADVGLFVAGPQEPVRAGDSQPGSSPLDGRPNFVPLPTWQTVCLVFSPGVPVFRYRAVRAAVQYGAAEAAAGMIAGGDLMGHVARGPWQPSQVDYEALSAGEAERGTAVRPVKDAAALLAESGWGDQDGDGVLDLGANQLTFSLLAPDMEPYPSLAGSITEKLRPVGVEVLVEIVPLWEMDRRLNHKEFEAALLETKVGPDPDLTPILASEHAAYGYNDSGYVNPQMDSLLLRARAAAEPEILPALGEILALLEQDVPCAWLYHPTHFAVLSPAARDLSWGEGGALLHAENAWKQPTD